MSNPVLVEVTRGGRVESRHRGTVIVVDAAGEKIWALGDTDAPIYPRSAVKAMQAMVLVESGAADSLGFGDRELALACSSHSGEPAHAELASAMLSRVGRDETTLECGCQWPSRLKVSIALARAGGSATQLHNNCSGKHAGFICTACHLGIDPTGYIRYGHEIQDMIRGVMADLTGDHFGVDNCATDGCSIPTYAVPLATLAHGFARMSTGSGLEATRAAAAKQIMSACMAEPYYVAGEGRACTRLMQSAPGQIFAKTGAEGVFCAALPQQGLAIALKCDDGGARAADAIVAGVLARFIDADNDVKDALMQQANRPVKNWNGIETGSLKLTEALAS